MKFSITRYYLLTQVVALHIILNMNKITFLGASGTVTGSGYFLSDESGKGIIVDFGMFQGIHETPELNNSMPPVDAKNMLGVVLTHAHLDHCGRLPILIRMGYAGKIYMTKPTQMLVELALSDAVRVAEKNHKEPLYTQDDVYQTLRQIEIIEYDQAFKINQFTITFRDAGHILGSASIEINNHDTTIVFSGDLGNTPQDLVRPTEYIHQANFVIMESTYGDKIHPREDVKSILQNEVNSVEKSGGVLLIPAFSLDRTQELLHIFNHLKKDGKIAQETPVYLDSPMGIRATAIYEEFPELYSDELKAHAKEENPFHFPGLTMVEDGKDSESLQESDGTKVIIAGNGMMGGGRIMRHASVYLPYATTRLLIVGYQAEETLGRKLLEGAKQVMIDDKSVVVKASVTEIKTMSAHADQPKLLNWLKQIKGVKKVFLTHGEDVSRTALMGKIKEELNIADVILPKVNDECIIS